MKQIVAINQDFHDGAPWLDREIGGRHPGSILTSSSPRTLASESWPSPEGWRPHGKTWQSPDGCRGLFDLSSSPWRFKFFRPCLLYPTKSYRPPCEFSGFSFQVNKAIITVCHANCCPSTLSFRKCWRPWSQTDVPSSARLREPEKRLGFLLRLNARWVQPRARYCLLYTSDAADEE